MILEGAKATQVRGAVVFFFLCLGGPQAPTWVRPCLRALVNKVYLEKF